MVELKVENSKSYANPFKDVDLECMTVSPSGRNLKVYGFFDGGNTWKLRLMPDEIGVWKYYSKFSDGAKGPQGTIKCIAGKLKGPLKISKKYPLWFERGDGTPVYISSFYQWHIEELDADTLAKTLDYLKSMGFNCVVSPHLSSKKFLWVADGKGVIDFSRFNLDMWQRFDKGLAALAERDMVLIPFNVFGGTNYVPKIPTREEEDLFIRYWVARWGGFWNVTYQPISEYEEGYKDAEVARICSKIHEEDGNRHVVSIHSGLRATETVQSGKWLDYHTIQDKLMEHDPIKYVSLAELYHKNKKPMLAHECLWEGNVYQEKAGLDMDNMRRGAWVLSLCGAQINYADEVSFPRNFQIRSKEAPFYSITGAAMKPCGQLYGSLKIISDFMRSISFWRLIPCPELSSSKVCLADVGKDYVAYSLDGAEFSLDLTKAQGKLKASWLNPRTGERSKETNIEGGASRSFTPPDTNDWVIYVTSGKSK